MNTPVVVPSQFLTATLTLGLIVLASFQTALIGGVSVVEVLQLLALLVGGVVTYFSPLLKGGWAAGLKVGGAVVGAVAIAAIGAYDAVVSGGQFWTVDTVTLLFFAGLNALAAQFGVDKRVADTKGALAAPTVSNAQVQAQDPDATQAAVQMNG